MNDQTMMPLPVVDVEKRVEQYVKLRDHKQKMEAELKEKLAPVNQLMDDIETELMRVMNQTNVDSLKASTGTVSKLTKRSASAADINAFWTWVITQGAFDMIDKKPNVTAITEYVKKHGVPPPGVNYSEYAHLGFRRKT